MRGQTRALRNPRFHVPAQSRFYDPEGIKIEMVLRDIEHFRTNGSLGKRAAATNGQLKTTKGDPADRLKSTPSVWELERQTRLTCESLTSC